MLDLASWRRHLLTVFGMLVLWQAIILIFELPRFILPPPHQVLLALWHYWDLLLINAGWTLLEIVAGLLVGTLLGISTALTISWSSKLQRWVLPVIVISQAIPVFALAPILMLWLGYGIASKIAMATLIIYFPVTSACFDGLRSTRSGWLDLAQSMDASAWVTLRMIRLPAALPSVASGLRMAAVFAPIGAVVGEWVGSSRGLGYIMLHANGRMQIDLMFAAVLLLAALAVCFYFSIDWLLKKLINWQPETLHRNGHRTG